MGKMFYCLFRELIKFTPVFIFGVFFVLGGQAYAAEGDYAIYREATAGDSITDTASNMTWDTTVYQGSGFSLPATDTIRLADVGKYLIMYSISFEQTGDGGVRRDIQSLVEIGGVDSNYGRANCYIRNAQNADTCVISAATVIETTSIDTDIQIELVRADNATTATAILSSNLSGITVLRMKDDFDMVAVTEAGGGQTFNSSTWTSIDWDTTDIVDSASFSHSGGNITIADPGHYIITSNAAFRSSVDEAEWGTHESRRQADARIVLDGTEIEGMRSTAYMRGADSTLDGTASFMGIIQTTSPNQVVSVQGRCSGEPVVCADITLPGGLSSVSIIRLRDAADYIRWTNTENAQEADDVGLNIRWDTLLEVDGGSFLFEPNNWARVSFVHPSGLENYLLFGSYYFDRTVDQTDARLYPRWEWELNSSTKYQYGSFGKYNRGYYTNSAGDSGAMILHQMSNSDYVRLISSNETTPNTDPNATFSFSRTGVSGVNLSTLFETGPNTRQLHFRFRELNTNASLNDSGNWLAAEDTQYSGVFAENDDVRVRFSVVNNGESVESMAHNYQLQYGEKVTNCLAISSWSSMDSISAMVDSAAFANGDATTEVLANSEGYSFVAGAGYDTSDTSSSFGPLAANSVTELEYSFELVSAFSQGSTYCFRLYNQTEASELDSYAVYPEIYISPPSIEQIHYRWRPVNPSGIGLNDNDSGDWGAALDTIDAEKTDQTDIRRIRFAVANTGSVQDSSASYQLEYAEKVTSCSAISSWIGVDDAADAIDSVDVADYTNGAATTEIFPNSEAYTFVGGEGIDTSDTTGSLPVLDVSEYVEIEYAIQITGSASGEEYCFRLVDSVSGALDSYSSYPYLRTIAGLKTQQFQGLISETSETIALNDPVSDLSRAFILMEWSGESSDQELPNENTCTAYLSSTDEITIEKFVSGGGCVYRITVVEALNEEFIVRGRGQITVNGSNLTGTASANNISSISDTSKVFISSVFTSNADSTTEYSESYVTVELTNATTVTAERVSSSGSDTSVRTRYEVVEWLADGVTVQTGEQDLIALADTPITTSLPTSVDESRSFLYTTFRHTSNGLNQTGVKAVLSDTQISFSRNQQQTATYDSVGRWWVIEFPAGGVVVTRGTGSVGTGNDNISIDPGVDIALKGSWPDVTNSNSGTGTAFPRHVLSSSLEGIREILLVSGYSGNQQDFAWQIVDTSQWEPVSGTLTVDIVDDLGASVASPSVTFPGSQFQFSSLVSSGTLGISTEKIRIENGTASPSWSATIATSSPTDLWSGVTYSYDYNDTSGAVDGGDTDAYGGQLEVDPSGIVVTPEGGCTTTGISSGASDSFEEGVVDSIQLLSSGGSSDVDCYWDVTGIGLNQTIPAEQPADTYSLEFIITVVAT